jgi:hypothetical protein
MATLTANEYGTNSAATANIANATTKTAYFRRGATVANVTDESLQPGKSIALGSSITVAACSQNGETADLTVD